MIKCKFCHSPYERLITFPTTYEDEDEEIYFELCGDRIRAYDNDYHNPHIESIKIKYCPMCGRYLKNEQFAEDEAEKENQNEWFNFTY